MKHDISGLENIAWLPSGKGSQSLHLRLDHNKLNTTSQNLSP